jgi:hypothetical protein
MPANKRLLPAREFRSIAKIGGARKIREKKQEADERSFAQFKK